MISKNLLKNKGFTSIEVTMVISMIALLSSVVVLALAKANKQSEDAITSQVVRQIKSELEINALEHGGIYPEASVNRECIRDMTGSEWPDKIKNIDSVPNRELCVRYYKSPDVNMAEIWAPLIVDIENGYNRKIGAVFGVKDTNDMRVLCISSKKFPIFNTRGNGTLEACNGDSPFDRVLDVESGGPAR